MGSGASSLPKTFVEDVAATSPDDMSKILSTLPLDSRLKIASALEIHQPAKGEDCTSDPMLEHIVEASFGAAYAIEWVLSSNGKIECKSWYNPEWRIKAAQENGWSGFFTTKSAEHTFSPGQGMLGKIFAERKTRFVSDVQDEAENKRMELAKSYNIHSVLFIPHGANGLVEVGTSRTLASAEDLLLDAAINTILSPPGPLQQLVEASYGGIYAIEWLLSDSGKLECKSWYNPEWRIKAAQSKGQNALFTTKSANCSFTPGEGFVGKIFERQETTFVTDFQNASENKRSDLAKHFGICSVLFVPSSSGLLEIGTNRSLPSAEQFLPSLALKVAQENRYSMSSSAKLRDLVEASFGGVYAIEWTHSIGSGELVCKTWYTPEWRRDLAKQKGLKSLFTVESANYTFVAGEGVVGKVFSERQAKFVSDIQSDSKNKRVDLAKEYGIRSVLFIPTATGLLEVGTTETLPSSDDFLPNEFVSSLLSAPTQLRQLVEASSGGVYGLEWALSDAGNLECKSWYNPQWRMKVAQQNGWAGLFTNKSAEYKFIPGEGMVGKIFAEKKPHFVSDMQAEVENKRTELAKKFGIRSVIFMPNGSGLIEIGTNQILDSVDSFLPDSAVNRIVSAPSQLQKLVDASAGGVYALEWVMADSGSLECKSWYNPYSRMKLAQQSGLKSLFTTQSATCKFVPGEGMVGKIFQDKKTKLVSDVQAESENKRKECAKQFGIRSVVFIPVGTKGLMEIGTNQMFNSMVDFLPNSAIEVACNSDLI